MSALLDSELKLYRLWLCCGIIMLLMVAGLSLIPVPQSPEGSDKVVHIVVYAILSGWFSMIVSRRYALWWIFIGVAGFGALIELLQGQTGYRSAELADAIANAVGAALGLVCHFTRLRQVLIKIDYRLSASR